jgi:hypothetical protein
MEAELAPPVVPTLELFQNNWDLYAKAYKTYLELVVSHEEALKALMRPPAYDPRQQTIQAPNGLESNGTSDPEEHYLVEHGQILQITPPPNNFIVQPAQQLYDHTDAFLLSAEALETAERSTARRNLRQKPPSTIEIAASLSDIATRGAINYILDYRRPKTRNSLSNLKAMILRKCSDERDDNVLNKLTVAQVIDFRND